MNKYDITVREVCEANYIIEANSREEAEELFDAWQEKNQPFICHDLERNCFGWEYIIHPAPKDSFIDISYDDAKKCFE